MENSIINRVKIIQSLWTQPYKKSFLEMDHRKYGGVLERRFFLMSWALSCLSLKKYYGKVHLYTDSLGKQILIDDLNLPYDEVYFIPEELNVYSEAFWAIGKIFTYNLQENPFLHVDGDFYIWNIFKKKLIDSPVIVQNIEPYDEGYKFIIDRMKKVVNYELLESCTASDYIAYNTGIFGGTNVEFINSYSREVLNFVTRNGESLLKYIDLYKDIGHVNIFFEQVILKLMADKYHQSVNCILNKRRGDIYKDLIDFKKGPEKNKYMHIVGSYKLNIHICEKVESQLRIEFPSYYNKYKMFFYEK